MPVIETIEVGTGAYPPKIQEAVIYIITKGAANDYMMKYTKTLIQELCEHMLAGTDLTFTKDGYFGTRAIILNDTRTNPQPECEADHVFVGANAVAKT